MMIVELISYAFDFAAVVAALVGVIVIVANLFGRLK